MPVKTIPIKYVEWLLLSMIWDEEDVVLDRILSDLEWLDTDKLYINSNGKTYQQLAVNLKKRLEDEDSTRRKEEYNEISLKEFIRELIEEFSNEEDELDEEKEKKKIVSLNFSDIEDRFLDYLHSIWKIKERVLKIAISQFQKISKKECIYTDEELNITASKIGTFWKMNEDEIEDTIHYIRYHYSIWAGDKVRLKILENALKLNKRISINREELLNIISEELIENLDLDNFNQEKQYTKIGDKTLDIPLSALSLLKYYSEDNLDWFFDLFSKIISVIIEKQVSSGFAYKKLNMFFLWNVINKLTNSKEKQFVDTIINYNLSIELSILLTQVYKLLKSYFPVVNYIFVTDKSLIMSDTETEYFNNENIPWDYSVGYFVKRILENSPGVDNILNSDNQYYNFIVNWEKNTLVGANLRAQFNKAFNPNKELEINSISEKIFWQMEDYSIKHIDRVYIWSSFFHFYTVTETNFRYIPDVKESGKLYAFSLDKEWNEEEIFFINLNDYKSLIEISDLYTFTRKEVAHYDYIQNTTIQNRPEKSIVRVI